MFSSNKLPTLPRKRYAEQTSYDSMLIFGDNQLLPVTNQVATHLHGPLPRNSHGELPNAQMHLSFIVKLS